ncbi:MAG: hypothetical protein Tsb0020_09240 [Haliangiales bacterium]
MRTILLFIAGALATSCAVSDTASDEPTYHSYVQTLLPFIVDDDQNWYLLDTGTPRTQVLPHVLGMPDDTFREMELPEWDVAALNPGYPPLIVSSVLPPLAFMEQVQLGGIIGLDLLREQRMLTFEPRMGRLIYGPPESLLFDVGPALDAPASIYGGGRTCLVEGQCFNYDASRFIVEVEVEGVVINALVDTGTTYVMTTPSFLSQLPARDDRVVLSYEREIPTTYSRFANFRLGEAEMQDVVFVLNERLGEAFARLHVETGIRVDMLVGHSFLEYFATTFDFERERLRLYPYHNADHVNLSDFIGHGVQFELEDECFRVSSVAITHIDQLALGDCVVAIAEFPPTSEALPPLNDFLRNLRYGDVFDVQVRVDSGDIERRTLAMIDLLPPLND